LTTAATLLNFKVIGQRSRSHGFFLFGFFFCVHDAAATRKPYLALSKVWWSGFYFVFVSWHSVQYNVSSILHNSS